MRYIITQCKYPAFSYIFEIAGVYASEQEGHKSHVYFPQIYFNPSKVVYFSVCGYKICALLSLY